MPLNCSLVLFNLKGAGHQFPAGKNKYASAQNTNEVGRSTRLAGRGGQPLRTSLSPAGPAGGHGPVWSILERAGGRRGSGSLHRPRSEASGLRGPKGGAAAVATPHGLMDPVLLRKAPVPSGCCLPFLPPSHQSLKIPLPCATEPWLRPSSARSG